MLNFIFVALCTWITTFLPFKNVSVPSTNEEVVEVVEIKQRNNMLKQYGWLIISPIELISRIEFYSHMNSNFYDASTSGFSYSMPYLASETYYILFNQLDASNPDTSVNNHGVQLTGCTYTLSAAANSGTMFLQTWNVNFTFGSLSYNYTCDLMYNNSVANKFLVSSSFIDEPNHTFSSNYFICARSSSYLYGLFDESADLNNARAEGYQNGYNVGYNEGLDYGVQHPNQDLVDEIYDRGYTYGYSEGLQSDEVLSTIFTGILDVSFIPVNVFIQIFDYEILGVNIAGLISGLLTVALLLILIRFITGRHV